MLIMQRVCDFNLYVQIFADTDATVAGIYKCMADYMKLAPFRSRDTIFSARLRSVLMNVSADNEVTTMPLLMMIPVG